MRGAADYCGVGAHGCGGEAGGLASRVVRQLGAMVHRTPRRGLGACTLPAGNGLKAGLPAHFFGCGLRTAAKFGPRPRSIREKIIGRSVCGLASCVKGRRCPVFGSRALAGLASRRGVLALLHQPARQHGRRVFFKPGIQQLSDLLAEIGRMAQTGEFVTLQRIAGCRQQEFPRRLGFVIQGNLQGKHFHSKCKVNTVNSTHVRGDCGKVCKSCARNWPQKSATHPRLGTL
jgi:hypothetical protein